MPRDGKFFLSCPEQHALVYGSCIARRLATAGQERKQLQVDAADAGGLYSGYVASYDEAHDASCVPHLDRENIVVGYDFYGYDNTHALFRGGLFFDTSALPRNAVILSATLSLWCGEFTTAPPFLLGVVSGENLGSNLDVCDYGRLLGQPVVGSISSSKLRSGEYIDIPIVCTTAIFSGLTRLGLITENDWFGWMPSWDETAWFSARASPPKLKVEYALPRTPITVSRGTVDDNINGIGGVDPMVYWGVGHGDIDVYTVECREPLLGTGEYADVDRLGLMQDRIVHLLSCSTGVNLGPALYSAGAKAYAGYTDLFGFGVISDGIPRPCDEPTPTADFYTFCDCDLELQRGLLDGMEFHEAVPRMVKRFEDEIKRYETGDRSGWPIAADARTMLNIDLEALWAVPLAAPGEGALINPNFPSEVGPSERWEGTIDGRNVGANRGVFRFRVGVNTTDPFDLNPGGTARCTINGTGPGLFEVCMEREAIAAIKWVVDDRRLINISPVPPPPPSWWARHQRELMVASAIGGVGLAITATLKV